jgi:hypothetical protein
MDNLMNSFCATIEFPMLTKTVDINGYARKLSFTLNGETIIILKMNGINTTLEIVYIKKYENMSGSKIISMIEFYANDIFDYIIMSDGSEIIINEERISLANFKILTTGISWYNSLGYFQDGFTIEKEKNCLLIQSTVKEIIESISLEEYNAYKERKDDGPLLVQFKNIDDFILKNSEVLNTPVIKFFKNINNVPQIVYFSCFDLCCTKIKYDYELTKALN